MRRIHGGLKRILGAAALTAALAFAAPVHAEKYASIVIDADTDTVLHARHADAQRYPASLTKVMTLYMLFDEMKAGRLSLNDKLTVSRYAANQSPSRLGLKRGSTIRVSDAIDALVTKSANDVAVVIAEHIGGTEARFARLMTVKAANLGLQNTTFRNASGLPNSRQVSTARDMAILADAMLTDHADYYHYFSKRRFAFGGRTYKNHNELMGKVDGVDGIKTGYTRASGFNLMASAERDGRRVIAVMLGGQTSKSRNAHVEDLIEAAYEAIEPLGEDSPALRTRVAFGRAMNPNAAATPMLNGKPFAVAETDAAPADEPKTIIVAAAKPVPPAPALKPRTAPKTSLAVLKPAPTAPPVAEPKPEIVKAAAPKPPSGPVGIATAAARLPLRMDSAGNPMTIAEYEAAQFGKH